MLVLSRKKGWSILIGDDKRITYMGERKGKACLYVVDGRDEWVFKGGIYEELQLSDDTIVCVVDYDMGRSNIGIDAPENTLILREELKGDEK